MKKSLMLILSMLLVFGFSASAFALHQAAETEYNPGVVTKKGVQIELSGQLRSRGEIRNNTSDYDSEQGDRQQSMDSRVRLKLKARVTKQTMGLIELESSSDDVGDTYTWGDTTSEGATGTYQKGNLKKGTLSIRQAYIAHQGRGLLGRLAGFKVGHMLLGLGNGLFFDHTKNGDDAVIFWVDPASSEISFTYVKLQEGASTTVSDDVNAYVLAGEFPLANANLSADVTFVDDQDFTTGLGTSANDTEGLHFWNFGLRGDTSVNNITLRADLELQTGKAKQNYRDRTTGARSDRKFKGYAWLVGADAAVNNINVGIEAAYGSGDKRDYANGNANDGTANWDSGTKNEAFQTTLGSSQHYTYVYEYRAASAAGATGTGLSNTWYINVGASTKPTPDLKVSTDLYYLRASKAANIGGALNSDGTLKTSKNLGTEIDGKLEYQIDKNLVYFIEGGYLFAGSAYDIDDNTNPTNGNNKSSDNMYAIRNGVVLKF